MIEHFSTVEDADKLCFRRGKLFDLPPCAETEGSDGGDKDSIRIRLVKEFAL